MQYTLLPGAPVIVDGWERDAANDQAAESPPVNDAAPGPNQRPAANSTPAT